MAEIGVDYYDQGTKALVQVSQNTPLPVTMVNSPAIAVPMAFSSNSVSVPTNTVLLLITDISAYVSFSLDNNSGFNLGFQVSQDGTNFRDVAMLASNLTTGASATAILLTTATLWTRGIKGISARVVAKDAASQVYAASTLTLGAVQAGAF